MSKGLHDDVRMRGFRRRADVDEIQAWVDGLEIPAPDVEERSLVEAAGRVLAEDLVSEVNVPSFPRAAMDGWAVRGEDTFGAGETDPVELSLRPGTALPGAPWTGVLEGGDAVRIMTGAPVPEGADAVLRAEAGQESEKRLRVLAAVPPRRHVGGVGEDVRSGTRVLFAGRRLRPQDVALAASVGHDTLRVRRPPGVGLLLTGSELVPPGRPLEPGRIVDSNAPMLSALALRDGGEIADLRRVHDARDVVAEALADLDGDVLLVSGGSSVGQEDHAPRLLAEMGELAYHGVAMRPASPSGAGLLRGRPVFLLPGNPVSCLSAYDFFAGRAVRRFAGRGPDWPYPPVDLPLVRKVTSDLGRVDYVRVRREGAGVAPLMARGASILSSTTEADGFLVVPRDSEGWPEGATVTMWSYDATTSSA